MLQMLAIGFIRKFQEVHRDSEMIEGEILADFRWRFFASAVLICIFLCQSERDL